jgi:hypothetical protein
MIFASYQWRFPESRPTAETAIKAALSGDRAAQIAAEIQLLRIHMRDPVSTDAYGRACRRVAQLEADLVAANHQSKRGGGK